MEEIKENKSIVTSYRLSQDTKEKVKQQLSDLGMTQEEYFNKVVSVMELENVKQNNIFAVNATELQELTQRINNIFIGLCEQGNSFLRNKDTELEELKGKYKEMLYNKDNDITELKEQIQHVYSNLNVLQNENDNSKIELDKIKIENIKQLEQMESNLTDKTSLIEEYKQKNDMILSDLAQYKKYKDQMEQYKELLSDAQNKNISLNDDIKNKDFTINELTKNFDKLKQDNTKDFESLKDKLSLDKDKAILELKQVHQNYVEELNNKHNAEIQEYQGKYKELLGKLETSKLNDSHRKNIKTKQEPKAIQDSLL